VLKIYGRKRFIEITLLEHRLLVVDPVEAVLIHQ
jgi:hypothetical protein